MELRSDFTKREVVRPEDYAWRNSPSGGVDRMMLDRIGDEVARATTIVRFAPGSAFDAHTHGGGEEYLVLEGVFSDESGDYGKGTYVRNPIGTAHTPHTDPGATILVKLYQFADDDQDQKAIDINAASYEATASEGVTETVLHRHGPETVRIVRFAPGSKAPQHDHPGGEELFVLEGEISDEKGTYSEGTWVRNPVGSSHAISSKRGALVWVKTGHLAT